MALQRVLLGRSIRLPREFPLSVRPRAEPIRAIRPLHFPGELFRALPSMNYKSTVTPVLTPDMAGVSILPPVLTQQPVWPMEPITGE